MSRFIQPMLASRLKDGPRLLNQIVHPKLDGVRAQIHITRNAVAIFNRNGLLINDRYPDVLTEFSDLARNYTRSLMGATIFDGEIVCGLGAKADFHAIQIRDKTTRNVEARLKDGSLVPAMFRPFDLLTLNGEDLKPSSLERRLSILNEFTLLPLVKELNGPDAKTMRELVEAAGYEGLIIKSQASPYTPGKRSPHWQKWKFTNTCSAVVVGLEESSGSRFFGALRVAVLDDNDRLIEIGTVGTGFKDQDFALIHDHIVSTSEPLVVEVEYLDFPDARLRQPVYKGIRTDVDPVACRLAQVKGE